MKPPLSWRPNKGEQPRETRGHRVRVKLRGDGEEPIEPVYENERNAIGKVGWTADTTRWSFSAEDNPLRKFDVLFYLVLR